MEYHCKLVSIILVTITSMTTRYGKVMVNLSLSEHSHMKMKKARNIKYQRQMRCPTLTGSLVPKYSVTKGWNYNESRKGDW